MVARAQKIRRAGVAAVVEHVAQTGPGSAGVEETARVLQALGVGTLAGVLDRPDAPLAWIGSAAPGTDVPCKPDDVRRALEEHRLPDGTDISGTRGGSANSWGIVLSDPKTGSLLLSHPDDRVREAQEAAHAARVAAFMSQLERLATCRMRDPNAVVEEGEEPPLVTIPVTGLVGAAVTHRATSYGDPSQHTHVLLSNMAMCADGKWRSLNSEAMIPLVRICEAHSLQVYKKSLSRSLGLTEADWTYTEAGSLQVPEMRALTEHVEAMSKAQRHIAECAEKLGLALDSRTFEQQATAYRKHRAERGSLSERIEHAIDAAYATEEGRSALRRFWCDQSPGLAAALETIAPRAPDLALPDPAPTIEEKKAACSRALEWAQRQSVWSWSDLTAQLASDPVTPLPYRQAAIAAARMIDKYAETGDVISSSKMEPAVRAMLERRSVDADELRAAVKTTSVCTTAVALEAEQKLRDKAQQLADTQRQPLAVTVPETATAEQAAAVRLMAQGRGLITVEGVAGAGKSYTVGLAADAARAAGLTVLCTARNAATAQDIGASIGVTKLAETPSVAALLSRKTLPPGPCLIVVDEGGVIDREDWQELLRRAADRPDVQIIALGDRGQAQMIDRSGAWHVVTEGTSASGKTARLSQSWRCQAWAEQHNALRAGNTETFLEKTAETGGFLPSSETEWAAQAAQIITEKPGVLALTMSNEEAADISRKVQAARGILGLVPCAGDGFLGVGDVVRTRKNDRSTRVFNGNTWTVQEISETGAKLRNEKGREVSVSLDYIKDFVELNYASTIDSAQGRTVEQALVVCRQGMGKSGFYSAVTRGKAAPLLLCVTDQPSPEVAKYEATREKWEAERLEKSVSLVQQIVKADDTAPTVAEYAEKIRAEQSAEWSNFLASVEVEKIKIEIATTPEPTPAPAPPIPAEKPKKPQKTAKKQPEEPPPAPEPPDRRPVTADEMAAMARAGAARRRRERYDEREQQRYPSSNTNPAPEPPPWEPPTPGDDWRPSI